MRAVRWAFRRLEGRANPLSRDGGAVSGPLSPRDRAALKPIAAPQGRLLERAAESWPSGRRRLIRNQVYPYGYRGFESHALRHAVRSLKRHAGNPAHDFGEVTEWSKVHDWKSCVPQKGTAGSNPALSAAHALESGRRRGPTSRGTWPCQRWPVNPPGPEGSNGRGDQRVAGPSNSGGLCPPSFACRSRGTLSRLRDVACGNVASCAPRGCSRGPSARRCAPGLASLAGRLGRRLRVRPPRVLARAFGPALRARARSSAGEGAPVAISAPARYLPPRSFAV